MDESSCSLSGRSQESLFSRPAVVFFFLENGARRLFTQSRFLLPARDPNLCEIVDGLLEGEHDDLLQDRHGLLAGRPGGRHLGVWQTWKKKNPKMN